MPVEFILFAAVLAGVALSHRHTMHVAVGGAIVIAAYKILLSPFKAGAGLAGRHRSARASASSVIPVYSFSRMTSDSAAA